MAQSARPSKNPQGGKPSSSRKPPASRPAAGKSGGGKSARGDNARLNQLRAQQAAKERRRRLLIGIGAVVAVVVVVAGLVIASVLAPKSGPKQSEALDGSVMSTIQGIPATTFDGVAPGNKSSAPQPITGEALTADGKPRVLYVGAEYCPYCAGERWPFVVAMSRFGTFTDLRAAWSAPAPEAAPNTPTLSFHGSSYTSDYLSFTGVETQDNAMQPLDTLSAEDQALFAKGNPKGSIPWIDFGGKYAASGASVDPAVYAGKSQSEIATAIADPSSEIGKDVLGSANLLTARLCSITGNKPEAVCSSPAIVAAAAALQ